MDSSIRNKNKLLKHKQGNQQFSIFDQFNQKMLFRSYKKRDSTLPTHRICYSELSHETPFNGFSQNQIPNMATIKKVKKILESKEQLLQNRIKVIKKEQEKILKRKENQLKLFVKLQNLKREHSCFISPNKTTRKISAKLNYIVPRQSTTFGNTKPFNHNAMKTMNDESEDKFTAQKLYLQKIQNAKRLKRQKNKNEVKISKQRTLQLNRKLQSAGMIRRNREKVRESRENFYRSRQESIKNLKEERIEQEKHKFMEIEKHIRTLQKEQMEALEKWKKVLDDEEYEVGGLKNLQINEANCWMD